MQEICNILCYNQIVEIQKEKAMKHLPPYETPELQTISVEADVITTSYADALPFLPTGLRDDLAEETEL